MNRRDFLQTGALAGTALATGCRHVTRNAAGTRTTRVTLPLIISTWPFGKPSNEAALRRIQEGGGGLDAVEAGIQLAEADLKNASVGAGGLPNAEGVVQLDACIMSGPGYQAGSVAGIEGIAHPISVARRVMEKTPHVLLVGDGARKFALKEGFASEDLLTEEARDRWEEWKTSRETNAADNHDTIALLVLMPDGHVYGGCSTSGLAWKIPGRVGDSPLIGSGLYVDDEVGAAGATGVGENVMRYCGTFQVVDLMRRGASPAEACAETIRLAARKDPKGFDLNINYLALNKNGEFGAAGTDDGFPYSVAYPGFSDVLQSVAVNGK